MRSIGAVLVAVTVGALSWLGAGGAAADTPIRGYYQYSDLSSMVGDHDNCRGTVRVRMSTPTGKRGVVRVTFTSFGFTGNQPGWHRNPKCTVRMAIVNQGPGLSRVERYYPMSFGPRPGQRYVRDIVTGSGPAIIGVAPLAINSPVLKTPVGSGPAFYAVIP
ncbi:enoyl-CoA hydratase [Gordonia sp. NPDC003424]